MKRKKLKLSLFANDMIVYVKTLKTPPKKQLESINKFSKVAGTNQCTKILHF